MRVVRRITLVVRVRQFPSLLCNLHRVNFTSFLYHVQLRIPFEHILRVIVDMGRERERENLPVEAFIFVTTRPAISHIYTLLFY